jgi:hypothetical protein
MGIHVRTAYIFYAIYGAIKPSACVYYYTLPSFERGITWHAALTMNNELIDGFYLAEVLDT